MYQNYPLALNNAFKPVVEFDSLQWWASQIWKIINIITQLYLSLEDKSTYSTQMKEFNCRDISFLSPFSIRFHKISMEWNKSLNKRNTETKNQTRTHCDLHS